MKQATPALNGLEQAAFVLLAVCEARVKNPDSRLSFEAHQQAIINFVQTEAEYLGMSPDWLGCHDRAAELCKGL